MTSELKFVDVSGAPARAQADWPTLILPKAAIDAEIERLASRPVATDGRRASSIAHPMNAGPVPCLAPGIDVHLEVLKPGEESQPVIANSSRIDICIRGQGVAQIGNTTRHIERFDVWNTPSVEPYSYRNNGTDLFVRISYSNAPLLESLEVHYVKNQDQVAQAAAEMARLPDGGEAANSHAARDAATPIPIGKDGAQLLGYEWLVDIDVVESKSLHWPWKDITPHLERVHDLDISYSGRHLYILYNPATGRRIGTSPSFFATIAKYPPNKVDKPHRHTSAAINYIMQGKGKSVVNGEAVRWEEGDLHFSAPGWAVHNHASREEGFVTLTIQDHPLHLANESLLWQETLKSPITKLGSGPGIQTNLQTLV
jgi:gentisate 1,2-dioxygenase